MEGLPSKPYLFEVRDRLPPQVYEAFYECFHTSAGQIVLDHLYWRVMMKDPADVREVGRQDLFRFLVHCIHLGWAERQGVTPYGDHGYPAHDAP